MGAPHNELERQQRRELRGTILRTARIAYGSAGGGRVSFDSILRVAGREWTAMAVAEEIRYLVQLQYLEEHSKKMDALHDDAPTVYSLAALGMRVLNGDLEDRSICL